VLLVSQSANHACVANLLQAGQVVVTGGLGTLGLLVARWLAAQGAAHVVLLGRSGRAGAPAAELLQLLGGGCPAEVQVVQADMGSAADVAAVLGGGGGLPVLAVMHAGGVLSDATVANQSLAGGLLHVHRAPHYCLVDLYCQVDATGHLLTSIARLMLLDTC
jgi:NAD(P)-dependent dehydrogenase (short-subunit alcohol dehydrogenase family)